MRRVALTGEGVRAAQGKLFSRIRPVRDPLPRPEPAAPLAAATFSGWYGPFS